jgi:hypothetical protein
MNPRKPRHPRNPRKPNQPSEPRRAHRRASGESNVVVILCLLSGGSSFKRPQNHTSQTKLPNPIAKNSSGTPSRRLRLSQVGQVPHIFCATANSTEVILAETEQGRGILGVIDGFSPKGIEGEAEIKWRKDFLRKIGYKL